MKNKYNKYLFLGVIVIVIVIVIYTFAYKESFGNECPTTLIKDGEQILAYNPTLAKIPGVNPIKMDSLDDYEKYIHWQRANNVQCPILYLDKSFNKELSMYDINSSQSRQLSDLSQSNGTGVLNHNLPINDKNQCLSENLNLGQNSYLAENLNLGQNLNSNYEYQYHSQTF